MAVYCFLEEILAKHGETMGGMAKRLKISRSTLWKLANMPDYNPSKSLMEKVCRHLKVDIGDLLSLKKRPKK